MFEEQDLDNRQKAAILGAAATLIIAVSAIASLESQIVDRERTLDMSATIEPQMQGNNTTMGINTGQGLDYGNVTYSTNVTKFLQVSADRRSLLTSEVTGNISEHTYYDREIYFEGNRSFEVTVGSDEPGYYEGELKMRFQVPETRWGSRWISLKNRFF